MRLRPTCTRRRFAGDCGACSAAPTRRGAMHGSPGNPSEPKALNETDIWIDGAGRHASLWQAAGTPPAADARSDRDRVPRERRVCHGHKRLRDERSSDGTTSQDAPAPKEESSSPAPRLAGTLRTVPARRRAQVDCHRLRRGDRRPSQRADAKSEIEISAVERETLIESTRLYPGRATIGIGAPAR